MTEATKNFLAIYLGSPAAMEAWRTKPEAERSHPERRRLSDLLHYLDAEHDYHAALFPDKEAQEESSELSLSKERLKKALRPLDEG